MKKGQAALEFLTTYGWALLVIVATIGAFVYFGIYNPQSLIVQKCEIETGFGFGDCKVTQSGVLLRIYNGLRVDITDVYVTVVPYESSAGAGCVDTVNLTFIGDGQTTQTLTLCAPELASASIGQSFEGDVEIRYVRSGEKVNHSAEGRILRKVEQ